MEHPGRMDDSLDLNVVFGKSLSLGRCAMFANEATPVCPLPVIQVQTNQGDDRSTSPCVKPLLCFLDRVMGNIKNYGVFAHNVPVRRSPF